MLAKRCRFRAKTFILLFLLFLLADNRAINVAEGGKRQWLTIAAAFFCFKKLAETSQKQNSICLR